MDKIVDRLTDKRDVSDKELIRLIDEEYDEKYLFAAADSVRRKYYGDGVYLRGLIEVSNHCKNNCYYCGIRCGNAKAVRYRLTEEEILLCCDNGYRLGFRTFVMQGGEDAYYTDERMCRIIKSIKEKYPDCAVTLSLGERSESSFKKMFDAGADRYLLRHETADYAHYSRLHPSEMSAENRQKCLFGLKKIGYQVGSGFMVGSPYQTSENLVLDLRFLQRLKPEMIGIGPYITHKDTPFSHYPSGTLKKTLRLIAILRLMFPTALIPSTTALGTINPRGRELGLCAGANVVMPNLSPVSKRKLYDLYDNKICTGEEAAECCECLKRRIESVGYKVVCGRGDAAGFKTVRM